MSKPIPQPPTVPLFGNAFDIKAGNRHQSIKLLFDKYGEIFKLNIFGKDVVFVGSARLTEELCDESRFAKILPPAVQDTRFVAGDGLFTAHNSEPNWGIAHRILTPSFGPLSLKDMFENMHDIASQLVAKWARSGPDNVIDVAEVGTLTPAILNLRCFLKQRIRV